MDRLARLLAAEGKFAEAEGLRRRALANLQHSNLIPAPNASLSVLDLADVLRQEGKLDEAEPLYRELISKNEPTGLIRDVNDSGVGLGRLQIARGALAEAEATLKLACETNRLFRMTGFDCAAARAEIRRRQGKDLEAEALYRQAFGIRDKRGNLPDDYDAELVPVLQGFAEVLRRLGDHDEEAQALEARAARAKL